MSSNICFRFPLKNHLSIAVLSFKVHVQVLVGCGLKACATAIQAERTASLCPSLPARASLCHRPGGATVGLHARKEFRVCWRGSKPNAAADKRRYCTAPLRGLQGVCLPRSQQKGGSTELSIWQILQIQPDPGMYTSAAGKDVLQHQLTDGSVCADNK